MDLQCSEGPYIVCGGGAGGCFSDLAALFTPYTTTIVSGMTAVTTVLDLPILVECISSIDRRIRTARTRPPIETLTSLSSVDQMSPCISFIYAEDNE